MSALSALRYRILRGTIRCHTPISNVCARRNACLHRIAISASVIQRHRNVIITRTFVAQAKPRRVYQSQVPFLIFANDADRLPPLKQAKANSQTSANADIAVDQLIFATPPTAAEEGVAAAIPTTRPRVRSPFVSASSYRNTTYGKLFKVELSVLAAASSAFGYYLAGGPLIALLTIQTGGFIFAGTVLNAFAAAVANQMIEVRYDAMMERTRTRPLVTGSITKEWAAALGITSSALGCGLLYAASGSLTAPLVALFTIGSYALIYTPLKRLTIYNTEIGALVGAMPVLVGAAAYNPDIFCQPNTVAFMSVLFGYAFMTIWQMPHFMMIANDFERQYQRAGYVMRGMFHGRIKAPLYGFLWAVPLLSLPIIGCHLDITTPVFLITGTAATSWFLSSYYAFVRDPKFHRKRGHVYIYFCMLFALICCHNTIHHGEILDFISQTLNLPLAEHIRSWRTLFLPKPLQSNYELKKIMPLWLVQTCPKLQHDHLIKNKLNIVSALCPVKHVENVKQTVLQQHVAITNNNMTNNIQDHQ